MRGHILTERNIRELVKMVDEEMDGLAHEQRRKLETVKQELADVNRALDRIWRLVETTDLEMADAADRIREHKQRKQQLERTVDEARRMLAERRELLDSAELVAAFAEEIGEFLATSELTETRAFLRRFIQGIHVSPGRALIRYTIPMPEDSPIGRSDRAAVGLESGVRKSVRVGGLLDVYSSDVDEQRQRVRRGTGLTLRYSRMRKEQVECDGPSRPSPAAALNPRSVSSTPHLRPTASPFPTERRRSGSISDQRVGTHNAYTHWKSVLHGCLIRAVVASSGAVWRGDHPDGLTPVYTKAAARRR